MTIKAYRTSALREWRRFATMVFAAFALAGCASTPRLESSNAVLVAGATELPAPTGTVNDPAADVYRIGPLDRLIIDVFGFQNLQARVFEVDASGFISLPLGGTIAVGGLTPSEAEQRITQQLRAAFVRNPQVSVNLQETRSRYVTVDGQVTQPGNYPIINNMTLMRAVAAARGAGEFARLEDVVVFRTVNGQRMAALYNLGAIRRGVYADPRVYSEDVIVVGDSPSRRIFRDFISLAPLLSSPIIALLSNNN